MGQNINMPPQGNKKQQACKESEEKTASNLRNKAIEDPKGVEKGGIKGVIKIVIKIGKKGVIKIGEMIKSTKDEPQTLPISPNDSINQHGGNKQVTAKPNTQSDQRVQSKKAERDTKFYSARGPLAIVTNLHAAKTK